MSALTGQISLNNPRCGNPRKLEALLQREDYLGVVISHTRECIKMLAPDGTLLDINCSGLSMLEAEFAEQVIGKNIYDLIPPADRDAFRAMTNRVCAGNQETLEFELVGLKGTGRRVETTAVPITNPDGSGFIQLAITRDITERHRTEQILAAKIRQQRAVAELGLAALRGDELQTLFDHAANEIARALGADLCWVLELLPDRSAALLRAGFGWKKGLVGNATAGAGRESEAGYTFLSSKPVIVHDLRKETRFSGCSLLHEHGVISGLSCIIMGDHGPWGVLGAHTKLQRDFSRDDVAFLQTVANVLAGAIQNRRVQEALQESETRVQAELADSKLLQSISAEMIQEQNVQDIYEKLTDAAVAIMRSDFASLQMLYPERGSDGELRLLAFRNFTPEAAQQWEWVGRETPSSCGEALRMNRRIIVPDVTQCHFFAKDGVAAYLNSDIHAVQSTPLFSRDGKLVGMISTHWRRPHEPTERDLRLFDILARQAADLIERKAAEDALRQSERRLRTMAEGLPNLVWTNRPDGHCDWLSSQWGRYTGIPEQELLGFNWLERVIHPDDRERTTERWWAACRDQAEYDVEYRIRRHDGEYRWFKTRGVPLRDESGRIIYWFGTCTDIEDLKQAEMGLQRLAAIVESSDDAIISKDLNGIVCSWNKGAERIFGYTADEVIGKPITVLMPPERINEEPGILERIRKGERIDHYETVRRRKDGTLLNVSLTVSPISDARGKVIGASKIARNITDRVRAKEKLEQTVSERTASLREAIAQMEEFSYSFSHDLRAPVRAMKGYAQFILDQYAARLDAKGCDLLERIVRGSARMEQLIHDVLTYTRLASSDIELKRVSLKQFLQDLVQQFPEFQRPRAEVVIRGPLPDILAHEPSLGQAVSNLLANGVKFVAQGTTPRLHLWTETRGDKVRLWVEDNGVGIQPQYQHRLFRIFERVHQDARFDGTGIGLAIVRKAAERMGGAVGVESDGITGSSFWIELSKAGGE
jgi:PAS domain S-box-containing protein